MKKITASGKTVDEAVLKALDQLETTRDKVEIRIIENPQKGLFGLFGGKPATVEVEVKEDGIEKAYQFLEETINKMGIQVEIVRSDENDQILFDLKGDQLGTIIGKRGQTLDSIQLLVNLVANRYSESYTRIQLDAENYRLRRKESLEQLANRLAQKALKTRRPVKLEPMSGLERKIIHSVLHDRSDIKTYSEGIEPRRSIVIAPK